MARLATRFGRCSRGTWTTCAANRPTNGAGRGRRSCVENALVCLKSFLKLTMFQYRPIGFFSGKMEFTFLIFANEVGGKFVPPTACEIAQKRRKELEDGDGGSSVITIA